MSSSLSDAARARALLVSEGVTADFRKVAKQRLVDTYGVKGLQHIMSSKYVARHFCK